MTYLVPELLVGEVCEIKVVISEVPHSPQRKQSKGLSHLKGETEEEIQSEHLESRKVISFILWRESGRNAAFPYILKQRQGRNVDTDPGPLRTMP